MTLRRAGKGPSEGTTGWQLNGVSVLAEDVVDFADGLVNFCLRLGLGHVGDAWLLISHVGWLIDRYVPSSIPVIMAIAGVVGHDLCCRESQICQAAARCRSGSKSVARTGSRCARSAVIQET